MNKNILKKFAIESRKDLMKKIKNKMSTLYVDENFNKEQKGDLYILTNENHVLNLTHDKYEKREQLLQRIKDSSLDQVIEEAAYTWFNRIIAIRYMEIHDYLPLTKDNQSLGIRVLSSKDNKPDPEILKFSNLINPDLDIDFKKEKYAELATENEKFKYVLLLVCRKLAKVIPQVFDGMTSYIDILMPDNLLNDTGFVTKLINEIPEDNFNQVEIIGWLYQYYNQSEKDRVIAAKKAYKKNEIPYATQLFTPDWIVKYMVENSLGKYWIEHSEDDSIKNNWKYFIKDNIEKTNNKLDPTKITFIDPCSGSGHILVYAFEVFYQIYLHAGYNKKDISGLILRNNLYGLDIDDRAGQLSILSVLLKAREYDKNIFNKNIAQNLHIMSIQESNNISQTIIDNFNDEKLKKQTQYLIDNFKNAKEIGSLLILEDNNYSELEKSIYDNETIFGTDMKEKLLPIIRIAKILSKKYDIVVTNPPYMNTTSMSINLKNYVVNKYTDYKYDLFSAFIVRNSNFTNQNGFMGFMTPYVWMFITSYKSLRKYVLDNINISSLIQMEYSALEEAVVPLCSFVLKNGKINNSIFIRLSDFTGGMKVQEKKYLDIIKYDNNQHIYKRKNTFFLNIPENIMAYWVDEIAIEKFSEFKKIDNYTNSSVGIQTGDNDKFLRYWWEVLKENICLNAKKVEDSYGKKKWFPYNKGGAYRKWYGNNENLIDWQNNGQNIINNAKKTGHHYQQYQDIYKFKPLITWSRITSGAPSFRYKGNGYLSDMAGFSLFGKEKQLLKILAFTNSNVGTYYLSFLAPTLNIMISSVLSMPFADTINDNVCEIVQKNIEISKKDWDSFETSWDFKKHPLLEFIDSTPGLHDSNIQVPPVHLQVIKNNYDEENFIADKIPMRAKISDSFKRWKEYTDKQFNTLKKNEEELNRIFIDIYGLQDELTPEEDDKDVTIRKADQVREIKSLISYAVGCMFGRYSLDKEGLIYAGGDFYNFYEKFKRKDGGWAGSSMANYRVLNDNGKEIDLSFEVNNDNVIPITEEPYFNNDIIERFKELIEVAYGKETLNENLDFIAETIGKKGTETSEDTIRRYFINDFFKDHVKTYQKRPIYWLFDSGKKNGFKALIYMHRYDENLVSKIRLDYLHRMQTTYEDLLEDINYKLKTELSVTENKEIQKKRIELNAKLQELKEYDEKIAHIANKRIKIDLDDGVKVNYKKFEDVLAKIK